MRKLTTRAGRLSAALGFAAAALAAGAAPADVYSWRTEDGGYAFTDDEDAIPARYRDSVKVRASGSLEGYRRYTPSQSGPNARHAEQLSERLAYLRSLNTAAAASHTASATAAPGGGQAGERLTLRGDSGRTDISIPVEGEGAPVVVEQIFVRRGSVVQRAQVTRRGDRILSVTLPRDREWNVNDFVELDELPDDVEIVD